MQSTFRNSLLLIVAAATAAVATYPTYAATPEEDFLARCAASGVVVCESFDNAATFAYNPNQSQGLYPNANNVMKGFQDTSIKASGTSSLRFDVDGNTPANNAGQFIKNFGTSFSQNSTFYVQYRQRFDSNMLNIDWNGLMNTSWKQSVIYDALPCANIELTAVNNYSSNIPIVYDACGNNAVRTKLTDFTSYQSNWGAGYYLQQGASLSSGYNCKYGQDRPGTGNGVDCYTYTADKWLTFYFAVKVGAWGSPNSIIEAFVAVDGGPYLQWTHVRDYTLNHDGTPSRGFNKIMFSTYMTNKSPSVNHATAHTWYDELIVSRQPIAAPGAPPGPGAPTNLRVN